MELISVIMPVYNVSKYVGASIESILKQTYSNFEFIIVDDCSTDDTYFVCKQYADIDNRIKLYKNEKNMKIEATLNKALSYAQGKYIVRQDGDDISVSNRFEVLKEYLDNHPDIALVGSDIIKIDNNGDEFGVKHFPYTQSAIKKISLLTSPIMHIWMTYKSIYDDIGNYRVFAGSEDHDFLLRLISKGYKCSNVHNFLGYKQRVEREGNSSITFGLKKFKSTLYVIKLYKQRQKKGIDTYSLENMKKNTSANKLNTILFAFSSSVLVKAVKARDRKQRLKMMFYIFLSLVSPYRWKYLLYSMKYSIIMKQQDLENA